MIFFQLLLTVSLLGIGLYAVALRRKIALLGNMAILVTMMAMFLVWWPDLATRLAKFFGVGRGVDLIFYCWVIISMMMILNLHLKIRIQTETITELIRQLAIARPFSAPENAKSDSLPDTSK
jgi:hypothetical protein